MAAKQAVWISSDMLLDDCGIRIEGVRRQDFG